MTNKEKYQNAFSTLHASDKIFLEVKTMENRKKTYLVKKTLAACAAVAVIFGSMSAAYAADLGGIREKFTVWLHGEQTEVTIIDKNNGSFSYTYTDEEGNIQERGGGGIAIDENGNETPLPAKEVLNDAFGEEVDIDNNGIIWLYYKDKKINITDLFDEDGICKVAVERDGETAYFTVKNKDNGYEMMTEMTTEMTTEKPDDAEQYTLRK